MNHTCLVAHSAGNHLNLMLINPYGNKLPAESLIWPVLICAHRNFLGIGCHPRLEFTEKLHRLLRWAWKDHCGSFFLRLPKIFHFWWFPHFTDQILEQGLIQDQSGGIYESPLEINWTFWAIPSKGLQSFFPIRDFSSLSNQWFDSCFVASTEDRPL